MMASTTGRTRHSALTYSSLHILAILLISFFNPVFAQSTTQTTATQTWTPAPACSNGLANPAAQNGTYVDRYGANWAVQCGQDSTGYVYDAYEGTNSQGVYACFKGCDSRPRCTAFMFQGTVSGATAGSGRCYYKYNAGTYYTNATVYAAANLISNGTPNLVCPYYNLTTYTAADNSVWQVSCGYDVTANSASTAQGTAGSVAQCMAQCNAISDCSLFSYTYIGAEPADGAANADGTCYYKKGSYAVYGGGTATVAALVRIGTVTNGQTSYSISPSTQPASTTITSSNSVLLSSVNTSTSPIGSTTSASPSTPSSTSTTSSTSSSSSSAAQQAIITTSISSSVQSTSTVFSSSSSSSSALASSPSSSQSLTSSSSSITSTQQSTIAISSTTAASGTATCTLNPVPSNPVCPGANQQMFTDSCGSNYTVYCGYDTNPGAASSVSASSLLQCMQACDNYSGCQAATWNGGNPGTCYLKTGYSGTFASSSVQAMVRYAPNPAYPAPIQAPAVNTSSGCGSTLPAGLTAGGTSVLFNYTNPSDGLLRNYTVHIPLYYDANHASPVIFAFPGNGEGASNIEQETGLSNAGMNPYAIAVYVNGYALGFESHPSWAPGGIHSNVDDIGFMKNLIANITASFCVDTGKIWATGHSNGGGFVNVMACDPVLSTQISVFTSNSGAYYTNASSGDPSTIGPLNTPVQALCSPGRANLPFLEMHGTNDQTINYYGGVRNGKLLPTIPHWATDWAIRDNLSSFNVTTQPSGNVTQYQFGGLSGNLGQITQLTLANWVHQWPTIAGGAPVEGSSIIMPFFYTQSNYSRAAVYANTTNSSTSSISSSTSYTVSTLSSSVSFLANTTSTATGVSSMVISVLTSSGGPLVTLSLSVPPLNTGAMSSSLATSSVTQSLSSSSSSGSSISFSLSTSAVSPSSSASTNALSSSAGGAPGYPFSSSTQSLSSSSSLLSSSSATSSSLGAPGYPVSSSTQVLSSNSSLLSSSSATSSSVGAPGYAISSSSQSSGTSSPLSSAISSNVVSSSSPVLSSSVLSATPSMTSVGSTTSPASSSSISTSAAPLNSSPPSFSCPANNGTIAPDQNSIVYQIYCGADTYGSNAGVVGAANSFDDCFYLCDSTSSCLAFTYSGGANGVGSGICYLKSGIVGFASGNANTVAAMRYIGQYSANQSPTSNQISPTASGSSAVSSTSSLSRTPNPGNYGSSTSMSSSMLNPVNYGSSSTSSSSLNNPGYSGSSSSTSMISSTSLSSSSALISSSVSSSQSSSMTVMSSSSSSSASLPTNPIIYGSSSLSSLASSTSLSSSTSSLASSTSLSSSTSSLVSSTSLSSSTSVQSSSMISFSSVPGYYGSSSSSTVSSTSVGSSSTSSSSINPPQYTLSSASSASVAGTSQSSMSLLSSMQSSSQLPTSSSQQNSQSAPQYGQSSSSSSSATSSAPPVPSSYYGVSCPASNGQTITDQYGIKYVVSCSSDTVPAGNYDSSSASYGFTDCFGLCDNSTTVQGVGYCNTFTYFGSPNGAGPGTCFFKSNANPAVVPSNSNHVAAIRVGSPSSSALASSSIVQSSSSTSVMSSVSNTSPPHGYSTSTSLGASSSSQVSSSAMSSSSSAALVSSSSAAQYGGSSTASSSQMAPPQYSLTSSSMMSSSSPAPPVQYSASSTSMPIAQTLSVTSPTQYTSSTSQGGQPTSSVGPPQYSVPSSQSTTNLVPQGYSSMASSVQVVSTSTTASSTLVQSSAPACPSLSCGYSQINQTCSDTYGNSFSVACSRAYTGTIAVRAIKNNVNDCLTACDMTAGCVAANYMPDTSECDLLSSVNGTMTVPGAAAASRPAGVSTVYTAPPTSMLASTTSSQVLKLPSDGYSNGISSSSNSVALMTSGSSFLPLGQYSQSQSLASSTASTTSLLPPGQYSQSSPALISSTSVMSSVLSPPGYGVSTSSIFAGTATSVSAPGYGAGTSPVLQSTPSMASAPGYGSASMPITSAMSTTAQSHASSGMSGPASYPTDSICPQYDGKQYTDAQDNTYSVECNMAYSGTVLSQVAKRQAQAYSSFSATSGQRSHNTPQSCMQICDSVDACVAFTIVGTNLCTFYSSVNGNTVAPGSIALYRVSRPGANISVITVSTCAATAVSITTRYTTIQSTTTIQCSDGSLCTTMS